MKAHLFLTGVIASMAVGAASTGHAAEIQLDISGAVNSNLSTYTGGASYPAAGSTVTIGGVDFSLASYYPASFNAPDVGVVQLGDGHPTSITIDTPDVLVGASTTFYSLINSAFGVAGDTIGNLTLNFAGGANYVYTLTEGDNIRDHYDGLYNNAAPNVYGTATYGDDRLDAQAIALPASFAGEKLISITLNNTDTADGNPFITAFTGVGVTSAVPEPATWAMMLGGLGVVGLAIRRRNAVAAAQA